MPLDPDYLMALDRPPVTQSYDWRDGVIYALGLGYGDEPTNPGHLQFLDREQNFRTHPGMANVLAHDGAWLRDPLTGIDYSQIVHGEQEMILHAPLPPQANVSATTRIEEIVDKGSEKGGIVTSAREITDVDTSVHLATVRHTVFCRSVGGFGGTTRSACSTPNLPEGPPAGRVNIPTPNQLALIYRLSGDLNPLHADPTVAQKAGFERPILHGLATFGIVARALIQELAHGMPERVKRLKGRFSAPVYPGQTIAVEWWPESRGTALARARVGDSVVLTSALFEYE